MIKELIKLANYLDEHGCREEVDYLDKIIDKVAHMINKDPGGCKDELDKELYYFKNLTKMLEEKEEEDEEGSFYQEDKLLQDEDL